MLMVSSQVPLALPTDCNESGVAGPALPTLASELGDKRLP
ncbi:hypothetical protein KR100_08055 [Synechococcus sp. KORDI-100]|nr:hypothetical protein KR100_08055 [Synechococcus sp. KORDI-100]